MKRILSLAIIGFILLSITGLSSCVRCSQEKYAVYFTDSNIIQLHDDGMIMSPVTPEGPFPEKNHVLTLHLKAPFNKSTSRKLSVGKEITVKYKYATGGYVIISRNEIEVRLDYAKDYWENHNGVLPLRRTDG